MHYYGKFKLFYSQSVCACVCLFNYLDEVDYL